MTVPPISLGGVVTSRSAAVAGQPYSNTTKAGWTQPARARSCIRNRGAGARNRCYLANPGTGHRDECRRHAAICNRVCRVSGNTANRPTTLTTLRLAGCWLRPLPRVCLVPAIARHGAAERLFRELIQKADQREIGDIKRTYAVGQLTNRHSAQSREVQGVRSRAAVQKRSDGRFHLWRSFRSAQQISERRRTVRTILTPGAMTSRQGCCDALCRDGAKVL